MKKITLKLSKETLQQIENPSKITGGEPTLEKFCGVIAYPDYICNPPITKQDNTCPPLPKLINIKDCFSSGVASYE